MTFNIEIACDNAAFGEDAYETAVEICRMLRNFSEFSIQAALETRQSIAMIDSNGNRVGEATFSSRR